MGTECMILLLEADNLYVIANEINIGLGRGGRGPGGQSQHGSVRSCVCACTHVYNAHHWSCYMILEGIACT
jgi:hypothetical protein